MNRKISIMLAFILIVQGLLVAPGNLSMASTNNPNRYDQPKWFETDPLAGMTWDEYKIAYGLPFEIKRLNDDGYAFSMEHWIDKRIVVYGGPEDVPANDFKKETFKDEVITPNQGYYENGTGEYRYHGFDAEGNLYHNDNFSRDLDSGSKPSSKNWIHEIWSKDSPYRYGPDGTPRIIEASIYNRTALEEKNGLANTQTRKWIEDGMPFEIENSTNPAEMNAYHYAHVLTRPTTLFPGEVVLWHDPNNYGDPSGKLMWNQTFTLSKMKDKAPTPVKAEIEIRSISDKAIDESGAVVIMGKIYGKIQDDHMYDGVDEEGIPDDVLIGAYYNREDIASWSFTISDRITGLEQTIVGPREVEGRGSAEFTITIPYDEYKSMISEGNQNLDLILDGSSTSIFNDGETATGYATTDGNVSGTNPGNVTSQPKIEIEAPIVEELIDPFNFDITAPKEMLDTEKFNLRDKSVVEQEGTIREIYLGGQLLSESEAEDFANGQHLFPLIGEDKIYNYTVRYIEIEGKEHNYSSYVMVYTTKPKAQFRVSGTFKENRLIEARTDIASVNSSYLMTHASIDTDYFLARNLEGPDSKIKYGTQNQSELAFIVKDQAAIQMDMKVTTNIPSSKVHRSDIPSGYHISDVYEYNLFVLEDYEPAMIANIWNSVLVRNEALDFYYDSASVDHDTISVSTYKIYYDETGSGNPKKLIKEGNFEDYEEFKPENLGTYKIVFYAEETFGQPTLSQFITTEDKRTATIERIFNVDNLAPMTKIYTDIEYNFPQADVMVLNDESITRELNNTIVSERVNWINSLRQSGISAQMSIWDLHTYVYSKDASTTRNTGGSYPSSTTQYSSDGYSGTLSRYNTVNNEYRQDDGEYVTTTESQTFSRTHSNTVTYTANYAENMASEGSNTRESSPAPSSKSINSGGFVGSIPRTGHEEVSRNESRTYWDNGNVKRHKIVTKFRAFYSGTLTKSTTVWVSDYNWYDNYTGYYSGTIYKYVKQSFAPSFRNGSDKYIVYFADGSVNNKTDIEAVLSKGDAKVILVSKASAQSDFSHEYWIDGTQSLEKIMKAVNEIIIENNPVDNRKLLLIGESFTTNVANYDLEGDPLSLVGFQYVQDADYFDNSMGAETGTGTTYSDTAFTESLKDSFSKVGKYTIHRMIEDAPVGKPSYGKVSNVPALDVYVHRKPIADFTLDWDYSPSVHKYKTRWVDLSYDLDHQFSDSEKGIRDRQIMYRKTDGDNQWIYAIPDNLTYGTYEVRYVVKDIEGVWSDPKVKIIELEAEPTIELYGAVAPLIVPASQAITIQEIQSKYHDSHLIDVEVLEKDKGHVSTIATLDTRESHRYSQVETWYFWEPLSHIIPQETKDGHYYVKLSSQGVEVDLPFQVFTPISVIGDMDDLLAGEMGHFTARAGKYASAVYLTLFSGTAFETRQEMIQTGVNEWDESIWTLTHLIPETIEEGHYDFLYQAYTPSGKQARHDLSRKVTVLKIESFDVYGYWNHWRGQKNIHGVQLMDNPLRFLSYEKVRFEASVIGRPDSVEIDLSQALKAMTYVDSNGNLYKYADAFGHQVEFPQVMENIQGDRWVFEYILPLTHASMDWDDKRLREPYSATLTVFKGSLIKQKNIADIDITGNVYDLIHLQPNY